MADQEINLKGTGVEKLTRDFQKLQNEGKKVSGSFQEIKKNNPFSAKELKEDARAFEQLNKNFTFYGTKIKETERLLKGMSAVQDAMYTAGNDRAAQEIAQQKSIVERYQKKFTILQQISSAGGMPSEEGAPEGAKGFMGGASGVVARRFGAAALGAMVVSTAINTTRQSLQMAAEFQKNLMDIGATFKGTNKDTKEFVDSLQDMGGFFGAAKAMSPFTLFGPQRSIEMAGQMSRAGMKEHTGRNLGESQSRSFLTPLYLEALSGVPAETFTSLLQTQVRGGKQLSTADQYDLLQEAIQSGTKSALETAETLQGIDTLTQTLQQRGVMADEFSTAGALRALSTAGPAFQGALGVQALGQMRQGLLQPGGGIAGRLGTLRAAGLGTGKTFFQAQLALERGDSSTMGNLIEDYKRMGVENGSLALSETMGISLNQAYELMTTPNLTRSLKRFTGGGRRKFGELTKGSAFVRDISRTGSDIEDFTINTLKARGLSTPLELQQAAGTLQGAKIQEGNLILKGLASGMEASTVAIGAGVKDMEQFLQGKFLPLLRDALKLLVTHTAGA